MFQIRRPIQSAAETSRTAHKLELFQRFSLGEAIKALPSPIPRINEINTIANACRDEPNSSAMDREERTSSPIEIPPVNATIIPAKRIPSLPPQGSSSLLTVVPWPDAVVSY